MPIPEVYDVAVVGSGPAGAAAALTLARGGLRVAILEKAPLPRYKTCGGGLLGRTLDWLPLDVRSVVERACFTAELHHHAPTLSFATRRDRPIVSMVMRDRFDHLIATAAEQAGARLLSATTVIDVTRRADRVELHTSGGVIDARFVIAADGVTSLVARKCGLPELRQVVPALECEVTVDAACFEKFSGAARFDFGLTPHGYAWVFPKREHLSIGVLTTRRGSCNLNDEYARYLAALGIHGSIREERHGYMIPGRPRDRLFDVPRILFTGDAAGLADPITAEGISAAILSGQLAAKAVLENQLDAAATMRGYRQRLELALLADLRVARRLARVLYDFPRVRAWAFASHGQRLSEFLTRVVMGETDYRRAVRRPQNYLTLLAARRYAS